MTSRVNIDATDFEDGWLHEMDLSWIDSENAEDEQAQDTNAGGDENQ